MSGMRGTKGKLHKSGIIHGYSDNRYDKFQNRHIENLQKAGMSKICERQAYKGRACRIISMALKDRHVESSLYRRKPYALCKTGDGQSVVGRRE